MIKVKMPALNERFGATAAGRAKLKCCGGNAAAAPSRLSVVCKRRECGGESRKIELLSPTLKKE